MSFPTSELAADPRVRRGFVAQLAERERRLAEGEQPVGWKLGFGAPAAMEKLTITAPLVGFLTSRSLVAASAAPLSVAGWVQPLLEPEIAVRVGADTAAGADQVGAIEAIAPAFELADLDPSPDNVEAVLAGNIFHRSVVVDERAWTRDFDLDTIDAELRVGGAHTQVAEPQAATGRIADLIEHVAGLLAAFGLTLRAGEIVICGSIVAPIGVRGGAAVDYRLNPIGSLSVRIEDNTGSG